MGRFEGRTALVTGAASGMGFLTARLFHEEGANVVMLDINADALQEKAAEIGCDWRICNVREYGEIEAAVRYAEEKYGAVDYTVSYAGGNASRVCQQYKPFHQMDLDALQWGIDVNFRAPMYMARAVLDGMIARKRGVIVNIGSIDGVTGGCGGADYSAEKAGLIGLTKSLSLMGAPHGVRSVCVSPGPVMTREAMKNMRTPMGRAAEVREVVDLVLFLCSDEAAFITGQNIVIDGGRANAGGLY